MSETEDEVVLEIEGTPLKCNKRELINNSDYFKAMFEGNFAERNKSSIKLEGIDLKAMKIILTLLWDETFLIDDEDILLVLQTACMLQFEYIRENCIKKLTEILVPINAIKIWFMSEPLDLRPLYLKAKNLALTEFNIIKDSESVLELQLHQLHAYLSNVNLQCGSELEVYNVCLKWFYENAEQDKGESAVSVLLSLMACVDFHGLSDADVKEMMSFPDVCGNGFIVDVLNCLLDVRLGDSGEKYGAAVVEHARRFLSGNKRLMQVAKDPFFFVVKVGNGDQINTEYYYDSYRRKRKYIRLNDVDGGHKGQRKSAAMLIFDEKRNEFLHCIDMSEEKYNGHEGFHILGYKEQIFMFGGEVTLGTGNWNLNFWVYDTIRERWERKTKLPFGRRHFHSCICGNYLYIIGGTGSFRIIQENMFWYNYKENIWSKQIMLPCAGMSIKCCNYKEQLFLLNISNRCGYLFIPGNCSFVTMNIVDEGALVNNFPDLFTVFTYKNRICIKGSSLIEMEITDKQLRVVNYKYLQRLNCDCMESVICGDVVYTLYKHNHNKTITIEMFSMETHEISYLFQNLPNDSIFKIGQNKFSLGLSTKLFSLQHHYKMGDKDKYVNELKLEN